MSLDELLDQPLPRTLPSGLVTSLLQRLEELAATASADEARALAGKLDGLLCAMMPMVEPAARRALASDETNPWRTVFDMGTIDLAHQLASLIAGRRESDAFRDLLTSNRHAPLLRTLLGADLPSSELAQSLDEAPETVSRKLRDLREAGLCDFRKHGKQVINFLTPAARSAMAALDMQPIARTPPLDLLDRRIQDFVPEVRRAATFSLSTE